MTDEEAVKAALPKGAGSHYLPLLNKVTPEIAQSVSSLDFLASMRKTSSSVIIHSRNQTLSFWVLWGKTLPILKVVTKDAQG
ncbi:hypothetical protein Psyaliredsea_31810 [Psychrobacter alimentarius]